MKKASQFELKMANQSRNVQTPAVLVRRAFKNYDSGGKVVNVLKNLNMTVTKGTIYGLLGYMESGKTTLLSCIAGSRLLNSGKVWVLNNELLTVGFDKLSTRLGYMPQQIALYEELSIKETILYFGWTHGIKSVQIEKQLLFMLNALDLPNQNCTIRNLSRSQQRRVSFAVTLLHDPELLLLDEPMSEIDPLLSQCLWHYLKRSVKNSQKTIIFSTRNFDDARHANTVGIMYDGRICVEDSPQVLLTRFNCASLERIFTNLSHEETKTQLSNNDSTFDINKTDWTANNDSETRSNYFIVNTKHKISTLLKKDFLRLRQNLTTVILVYAVSIIQVILFCLSVGRDPTGLKLAVVNEEMNFTTKECPITKGCTFKHLSCRYLAHLNEETIDINYYPDLETAVNAVHVGKAWGALHFGKNFTDVFIASRIPGLITNEKIFNEPEIKVWLDQSNQPNALELRRRLRQAFRDFSRDLWNTCKRLPFKKSPIKFKKDTTNPNYTARQRKYSPENIVAIVNFETNQTSLKCPESQVCSFEKLSCHYLPYLYQQLEENNLKWYNELLDTSLKLLGEGNISAVLYIPYNFTNSIATKWLQGHSFEEVTSENETPEISLLYYNVSAQEYGMSLNYSYNNFLRHLWDSCKNDMKDLNIVHRSENDYAVNFIRENKEILNTSEYKLAIVNGYVNPTDGKCSIIEDCSLKTLNCQFIEYLRNLTAITVEEYSNVQEALVALWKRHVSAVVFVYIKEIRNTGSVFWMYNITRFNYGVLNVECGYNIWLDTLPEQEITGLGIEDFITNNFNIFFNIFMNNCHKLLDVLNPPVQNKTFSSERGATRLRKVLAIVNEDGDFMTEDCPVENGCTFSYLSCRYLRYINSAFKSRQYSDMSSAKQISLGTDIGGVLHFEKNFTAALVKRWFLGSTDKKTLRQSIMEYWDNINYEFRLDYGACPGWGSAGIDETFSLWQEWKQTDYRCFGNDAYQVLRVAYSMFLEDIWESCRNVTKVIDVPIKFESTFETDDAFADFVAPGFILIFIHFLSAVLVRTEIIIEKSGGVFDRSLTAGLSAGAILFSLVVMHSVIMCGQATVMYITLLALGATSCRGNIASVIALTLLQGLCGICFGLAVAIVFKSQRTSLLSIVVSLSVTLIIGGVIWPIEGMPLVLNYVSRCMPLTQAIASLRAILTRGTAVTDPDVYLGFMATATWITFFISICATVLKFSRNRKKKTFFEKWI